MRTKIFLLIIGSIPFIYSLVSSLISGYNITSNPAYIIYILFIVFLLPAIISKLVFKKGYLGTGYVISTLIYPLIYIFALILNRIFGVTMTSVYSTICYSVPIVFTAGMYVLIIKSSKDQVRNLFYAGLVFLLVTVIYIGLFIFLGRGTDSIIATDVMEQQVVVNAIMNGKLCLTPNDCSILFLKVGYTTYYHSILALVEFGFNIPFVKLAAMLDIFFPAFSGLILFNFAKKYLGNKLWGIFVAIIASLFFYDWGFTTIFFLPQSYAFLLFIIALHEKKADILKTILSAVIILSTHFVFGPIFAAYLLAKRFIFDIESKLAKYLKITLLVASIVTLGVAIYFCFNHGEIEQIIQQKDLAYLGVASTNLSFSDNIIYLFKIHGVVLILFICSIIPVIAEFNSDAIFFLTYVFGLSSAFFIGPTYARKFIIGTGIFMLLCVVHFLKRLNISFKQSLAVFILLVIQTALLFYSNYYSFTVYAVQSSGEPSHYYQETQPLLDYLKNYTPKCTVVSDPYTQLEVETYAGDSSINGHFVSLDMRETLFTYITQPSESSYNQLYDEAASIANTNNLCFIYSPRMEKINYLVNPNSISWLSWGNEQEMSYMYTKIPGSIRYIQNLGGYNVYADSYFIVMTMPKPVTNN